MGTLGDLVGDLTDLYPPLDVPPGTVLLTFRHGAPVDVIHPGKKLRRGRGLPMTMAPQGLPISTAEVPIDVHIEDIALPGPYNLPRLEARVLIRVDDRDDFCGLQAYVKRKGFNFAELLDGDVRNEIDKTFRTAIGRHNHVDLFKLGNLSHLVPLTSPLLSGLFRIETVQWVEPTWHAEFLRTQDALATKAREAAELLLQHEALELHRQVAQDEDRVLLDRAERRGVSMLEFENPEIIHQAGLQRHELQLAIIQNADALRRVGNGEAILDAVRVATADQPSSIGAASIEGFGEPRTPGNEPLDKLKRDSTLMRLWRNAGLPGEPAGMGIGESVILAVYEGPETEEFRATLKEKVGQRVDAREVITVNDAANVEELVRRYLVQRVPELAAKDISISISAIGTRLLVDLTSSTTRLSPLLGRIKDPATDVLPPLRAVVPYDAIDVTVAGNG